MVEQKVIWIILLVVFFVLIIGGLGIGALIYYNMSATVAAPVKADDKADDKTDDKKDELKKGLYYVDAGASYVNGWNLADAKKKMDTDGTKMASKENLMAAHAAGFGLCAYGWTSENVPALVMQTKVDGCGPIGYSNNYDGHGGVDKFGIYVYGSIPKNIASALQKADV